MEPEKKASESTIVVGQLAGVLGVKGWLKIRSYTQPERNILSYSPWWLKTPEGLKEVVVTDHKVRPQGLAVHFEGVDDREVAALFGRQQILVSANLLPELEDDEYYLHQFLGLRVISVFDDLGDTAAEKLLGVVSDVMETGANDVLMVESCKDSIDDQSRLIPYVLGQYIVSISLDKGEIRVNWDPEF